VFYPNLTRRAKYKTTAAGKNFSTYSTYRDEIFEDSEYRCAYCDITNDELGGEGFQLDHFRPVKRFPLLKSEPTNLVCSCPKCNRYKSDHWPSLHPKVCFIEPFEVNRNQSFQIAQSGIISHAADRKAVYKIRLLDLNRPSRIQIRRKRFVKKRIRDLFDLLGEKIDRINEILSDSKSSRTPVNSEIVSEAARCKEIMGELRELME